MKVPQYLRCLFGKHLPIGLTDGKRVLFLCDFCMCNLSREKAVKLAREAAPSPQIVQNKKEDL